MKVGTIVHVTDKNVTEKFQWYIEKGFTNCQLSVRLEDLTEEYSQLVNEAVKATGMEITALIGVWGGPKIWDFYSGPMTLGIVPVEYRANRLNDLLLCAKFAKSIGTTDVATHLGFIPENPNDPVFRSFLCAVKYLTAEYKKMGMRLLMETGQETPTTLLRVFEEVGADNLGLNLDPANLLMYGKANPVDALDQIGEHVMGVHGKDGEYPTSGKFLGKEVPLGEGRVNFPVFIPKLKAKGYDGAITIEREIDGEKQLADVLGAKAMLEGIIAKM